MNMSDYYHVRISPKHQGPNRDFQMLMNDMAITDEAKWDQDSQGKIKKGDYLAFITGPTGNELVYIFLVKQVLSLSEREEWWATTSYMPNNGGAIAVAHRAPMTLTNVHDLPKTWSWQDIKTTVGLSPQCSSWMPRGTQRINNAYRLPFKNPFLPPKNGLSLIQSLYE